MGKFFRWLLMVGAGSRWMRAKIRILLGKRAKLATAPAKELGADSTIQTATSAPLRAQPIGELVADKGIATAVTAEITASPAAEMVARKGVAVGVRAGLRAYIRAGCVFIRRLLFGVRAELTTAPATEMGYHETIRAATSAPAIAADSQPMESTARITQATRAEAQTAPAQNVPAVSCGVPVETTAQIGKAAAVDVGVNSVIPVRTCAKMATWIEPEVVDGVLVIRQAYHAAVVDGVLEVE